MQTERQDMMNSATLTDNSKLVNLTRWIFLAGAFFLAFRTQGQLLKIADILFIIAGVMILSNPRFYYLIEKDWRRVWRPWTKYFLLLILSIIFGQAFSWWRYGFAPTRVDITLDYMRLFFNVGVFFLAAFLMYSYGQKLIKKLGVFILVSFAAVLPIFIKTWQPYLLLHGRLASSGRLAGFLESPIVFGAWAMVAFLIGLGFFLQTKNGYLKILTGGGLCVLTSFILWSGTRSAWIALLVGIATLAVFYYLKERNFLKIKILIIISSIVFVAGYGMFLYLAPRHVYEGINARITNLVMQPLIYQSRTAVWEVEFPKIVKNPIGFGLYGKEIPQGFPGSSNSFLEVAAAGGVPAFLAFLFIVGRIVANIKIAVLNFNRQEPYDLYLAWFALLPAILITIFLFDFFMVRILWFTLGITAGISLRR